MILLLFAASHLFWAIGLVLVVRFFLRRLDAKEAEWRAREKRLTDELLRYAHVSPLEVKQERVAKIPDPEVAPMLNDIDLAFYNDNILEDLEQIEPSAVGMTPDEAKESFPTMWAQLERQYKVRHQPMRIAS